MLVRLFIKDFALIRELEIEFCSDLNVFTGETGAGKSIIVDAMGLVLGERGGSGLVRSGASRAELTAEFDLGWEVPVRRDPMDSAIAKSLSKFARWSGANTIASAVPLTVVIV